MYNVYLEINYSQKIDETVFPRTPNGMLCKKKNCTSVHQKIVNGRAKLR